MIKKLSRILIMVFTVSIFGIMNIESAEISNRMQYRKLDPMAVSTFHQDRIVYQHVEQDYTPFYDDSYACLLIIKDRRMFFFEDGYDDREMEMRKFVGARAVGLMIHDLWPNKISGTLNHAIITDRRVKSLESYNPEFVEERFGQQYKEARDKLLQKHIAIFYGMLLKPNESQIIRVRRPIPRKFMDDDPIRFFQSVALKTLNDRVYYAADTNGDGVTDVFTVTEPDGFHWGFKSGPNLVFIYNNTQEDIKGMIGTLVQDAFDGTEELWNRAISQLIQVDQIEDFIGDLYDVSEARREQ